MKLINLRVENLVNPLGLDTPTPRFSWAYEADPNEWNFTQTHYHIQVFDITYVKHETEQPPVWESGWIESQGSVLITYEGQALESFHTYRWKLTIKGTNQIEIQSPLDMVFSIGALDPADWQAQWIGEPELPTSTRLINDATKREPVEIINSNPSPYFQHQFSKPTGEIIRAYLYITALGDYEAYLNGQRIGDRYLSPEWTNFSKRVLYQTYQIDNLIAEKNALGVVLGDGWYMGLLGPGDRVRQRYYGTTRKVFCELHCYMADNTLVRVTSDGTWKYHPNGEIQSADHFMGEVLDSQKAIPGWNTIQANLEIWKTPVVYGEVEKVSVCLEAQKNEPVQVFQKFNPKSLTVKEGKVIINFGQNLVGFCNLTIKGAPDQEVQIRHAEMLESDGNIHTENLRLAEQKDTFILNGELQSLHPHFTFHGFQYIEITGLTPDQIAQMKELEKKENIQVEAWAFSSNPKVGGTVGNLQHPDQPVNFQYFMDTTG